MCMVYMVADKPKQRKTASRILIQVLFFFCRPKLTTYTNSKLFCSLIQQILPNEWGRGGESEIESKTKRKSHYKYAGPQNQLYVQTEPIPQILHQFCG